MTHLLPRYLDPIEHALDDFSRAIISGDNLPLTLHEVAQAPTKDSDALSIYLSIDIYIALFQNNAQSALQ